MQRSVLHIALLSILLLVSVLAGCTGGREDLAKSPLTDAAADRIDSIHSLVVAFDPEAIAAIRNAVPAAADSNELAALEVERLQAYVTQHPEEDVDWGWSEDYFRRHPSKWALVRLATIYNLRANQATRMFNTTDSTILYYSLAIEALEQAGQLKEVPKMLANIGDAYRSKNNLPQAAAMFRRALVMCDSLGLPQSALPDLYMGLGRIYTQLADYTAAETCYGRAGEMYDSLQLHMKVYYLVSLGNMHYYAGNYSKALPPLSRLETLLDSAGFADGIDMAVTRVNIADTYLNLDSIALAQRYLELSEAFFRANGIEPGIYYANTVAIGLAMKKHRPGDVARIIAAEHYTEPVDYQLVNIRNRYLLAYYRSLGDYRRAFELLEASRAYNDSLQHNASHMRSAEIMSRYTTDTLRLHHRLASQAKDAQLTEQRELLIIIVISTALIIAGLMAGVMWSRRRRMHMRLQLMELKLASVRTIVSPHFVFNLLNQRIASTGTSGEQNELTALSHLIRSSLDLSGKTLVGLDTELKFVDAYVKAVAPRLPRLHFSLDIDPAIDTQSVLVPPASVQLLVENAVKHALATLPGEQRLAISVTRPDPATCRIEVSDNGPGFDITRTSATSTGKGLQMIRDTFAIINRVRRMRLRFEIHNRISTDGVTEGSTAAITVRIK